MWLELKNPRILKCLLSTLQRHNNENSKQICPEKELRGLSPNSNINVSVSYFYIPHDWSTTATALEASAATDAATAVTAASTAAIAWTAATAATAKVTTAKVTAATATAAATAANPTTWSERATQWKRATASEGSTRIDHFCQLKTRSDSWSTRHRRYNVKNVICYRKLGFQGLHVVR